MQPHGLLGVSTNSRSIPQWSKLYEPQYRDESRSIYWSSEALLGLLPSVPLIPGSQDSIGPPGAWMTLVGVAAGLDSVEDLLEEDHTEEELLRHSSSIRCKIIFMLPSGSGQHFIAGATILTFHMLPCKNSLYLFWMVVQRWFPLTSDTWLSDFPSSGVHVIKRVAAVE